MLEKLENKQHFHVEGISVGHKSSERVGVLGIWTSNMNSLISKDIREHYEQKTVGWPWEMRRTFQIDIPEPGAHIPGTTRPVPGYTPQLRHRRTRRDLTGR